MYSTLYVEVGGGPYLLYSFPCTHHHSYYVHRLLHTCHQNLCPGILCYHSISEEMCYSHRITVTVQLIEDHSIVWIRILYLVH